MKMPPAIKCRAMQTPSKTDGLSQLLTSYGSDESEDSISDDTESEQKCGKDDKAKSTGLNRRQSSNDDGDRDKRETLPLPQQVLEMFTEVDAAPPEDPTKHGGRVRSFAHFPGNWALHVFIPFKASTHFESLVVSLLESVSTSLPCGMQILPSDDLHISVSRTVPIRHYWIDPIVQQLKNELDSLHRFVSSLDCPKLYTNDEKTRSFVALKVTSGQTKFQGIVDVINRTFNAFSLPVFYKNPSFHVSVAWSLGDVGLQPGEEIQTKLQDVFDAHLTDKAVLRSLTIEVNKDVIKRNCRNTLDCKKMGRSTSAAVRRILFSLVAVSFMILVLHVYTTGWWGNLNRALWRTSSSITMAMNRALSCQPVNRIYYLKTHKTASSTLANIFIRYGWNRNLTFVLPNEGTSFNWPQRFHLSHANPLNGEPPNILFSHARYNRELINWLFPKRNTKYITIIRNPAENVESAFTFYHIKKILNLVNDSNALETFLESPKYFFQKFTRARWFLHLRNPMLFDMGLDHHHFQNLVAVQKYLDFIEQEFDLVLIADHFDESLILLKRLLCWAFEDIVYMKQKVRVDKEPLKKEVKQKIVAWNKAEALLFEYFNKTLWKKIFDAGPTFTEDLQTFRRLNQHCQDACESVAEKSVKREKSLIDKCDQMLRSTSAFADVLIKRSRERLADIDKFQNEKYPVVPLDSVQ